MALPKGWRLERLPTINDNDYPYAAGMRIARIVYSACSAPTTCYYHVDALGSTRLVTYCKGVNVAFSDNYHHYGEDKGTSGSET